MQSREHVELDNTGKIIFDDLYNAPNPCKYYITLSDRCDYQIPENARPVFRKLINDYREQTGKTNLRILDIGCSYGVNALLLKCNITMRELVEHYREAHQQGLTTLEMIKRDKELVHTRRSDHNLEVIGLDRSGSAIEYGIRANILDDGIDEDFEQNSPSADAAQVLEDVDLIISTGCIGYVTATTLKKVITLSSAQNPSQKPWMANCILRMFPFEEIDRELREIHYRSQLLDGSLMKQRRFANPAEKDEILKRLNDLGICTSDLEDHGWFYANAFLSLPDIR